MSFDYNKLDEYKSFMENNGITTAIFYSDDLRRVELTINKSNSDWDLFIRGVIAISSHESYEDFKAKVTKETLNK